MDKYLFALDIDGTTIDSNDNILEETKTKLHEFQNMGHEVVLITGRTWNMTKDVYKELEIANPTGVFNGSVIIKNGFDDLNYDPKYLNEEFVKEFLNNELFKISIVGCMIDKIDKTFTNNSDMETTKLFLRWSHGPIHKLEEIESYNEVISILGQLSTNDDKEAHEIVTQLKQKYPKNEISYWRSHTTDKLIIEVSRGDGRKDFALRALSEYFNIPMKNTVAFGDGDNDKEMLMAAGHGVAMLNASDYVKEFADDVTEYSNQNNGVVRYIEKFLKEK